METVDPGDHADGYRIDLDLDQEWLPPRTDSAPADRGREH
jgi:hypothetical protein